MIVSHRSCVLKGTGLITDVDRTACSVALVSCRPTYLNNVPPQDLISPPPHQSWEGIPYLFSLSLGQGDPPVA